LTTEEWNTFFAGHWNIPGEKQNDHLAMFPQEIPRRLIRMFSFIGDTVLDPFLGSGTTCIAARNLDRNSVGYEVNPEFIGTIRRKLGVDNELLFPDARFEFLAQEEPGADLQQRVNQLPYVFRDPIQFDKKIDPKALQFGSRIRADGEPVATPEHD
jgi:site-specific DNA-methyltransferase (adenine-specific)